MAAPKQKRKQQHMALFFLVQLRMKDMDTKEVLVFHPVNRWLFEEDGSETVTELAAVRPDEAPLKGMLPDCKKVKRNALL